jgi:hypothetical protein
MNSITPLVKETERTIAAAVRAFDLNLDASKIVVTIQTAGRKRAVGWYWSDRWMNSKKAAIHEINLCAEHLRTHDMGELILHELAHAENASLGIKDCTKNQTHNKHFKAMAERLGLKVADYHPKYGFGFTELDRVGKTFLKKVGFKYHIFKLARLVIVKAKKKAKGLRLYECEECGQKIRAATDTLDCQCNECDAPFTMVS